MINTKKLIAASMVVATISASTLAMSVSASGNYTDTAYSFKVSSSKSYTDWREKLDDTSASIKVQSGKAVIVRVYGKGLLGSKVDCTYNTPKTVSVSSTYTMLHNTVYENEYDYACLGLTSSSGSSFTSSDVWSPDSI